MELLTGLGHAKAPAGAVQQGHAQSALELLHLLAHGGAGQPELSGRLGEAARIDRGAKRPPCA